VARERDHSAATCIQALVRGARVRRRLVSGVRREFKSVVKRLHKQVHAEGRRLALLSRGGCGTRDLLFQPRYPSKHACRPQIGLAQTVEEETKKQQQESVLLVAERKTTQEREEEPTPTPTPTSTPAPTSTSTPAEQPLTDGSLQRVLHETEHRRLLRHRLQGTHTEEAGQLEKPRAAAYGPSSPAQSKPQQQQQGMPEPDADTLEAMLLWYESQLQQRIASIGQQFAQ
jgi:hypothetical protein